MRTPTIMKTLTSLALLSLVSLTARGAHADEPPKFSALARGAVPMPPQKVGPAALSPRESVPGFFVVSPEWPAQVPAIHRHVSVTTDAKIAEQVRGNTPKKFKRPLPSVDASGACMAESDGMANMKATRGADDFGEDQESSWNASFQDQARAFPKQKDNPRSGVAAVHSERLVDQNGALSLESVDVWVDPSTRGVRLIGKATLPLTPVGTTVGGIKIYAGREERADGKKLVQFVILNPKEDPESPSPGAMWATLQDGESVHTNCGHLRVALPASETGGDHAIVQTDVRLPDKGSDTPDATRKAKGEDGTTEKEVRRRPMQIQLSVSRTSRDKEPVISVSYGWAGREQARSGMFGPEG